MSKEDDLPNAIETFLFQSYRQIHPYFGDQTLRAVNELFSMYFFSFKRLTVVLDWFFHKEENLLINL